jgi:hypothetical protein
MVNCFCLDRTPRLLFFWTGAQLYIFLEILSPGEGGTGKCSPYKHSPAAFLQEGRRIQELIFLSALFTKNWAGENRISLARGFGGLLGQNRRPLVFLGCDSFCPLTPPDCQCMVFREWGEAGNIHGPYWSCVVCGCWLYPFCTEFGLLVYQQWRHWLGCCGSRE